MTREEALAKARKCMALSKSSHEHEAAAALRQAHKLMQAYCLDEDDVARADVAEARAKAASLGATSWDANLSALVAEAFGCVVLSLRERMFKGARFSYERTLIFIGTGANGEVASYAYAVLARQCQTARREHIRRQSPKCKAATKTARGDAFALGWVYSVARIVREFAGKQPAPMAVEAYVANTYSVKTTAKASDRGGRGATGSQLSGMAAGRSAQLALAVPGQAGNLQLAGA